MTKNQKITKATGSLFFLLLACSVCLSQDYLWPTNASKLLTSSFAETRPNRLHSAIDIKTWGKEGYKVFATRNGYIWKVKISPFGYGKVIYQILDTGEIALYAHLQKFSPYLENIMRKTQKKNRRHSVTKFFKKNEFPIQKGDLIAFTGSTGIGYPHLHFEIRNTDNFPTNPLLKGFKIKDTLAPVPTAIGVETMNLASQINGWSTPQIFQLIKKGRNTYTVKNPIQIWGMIGFSISAYDQANGARNKFSLYQLITYLDGEKIFHSTYDKFSFNQNTHVVLDRNNWFLSNNGKYFHNLFLEKLNKLPFYHSFNEEQGILYTMGYADSLSKQTNYLSWLLPEPLSTSPMAEFDNLYLQMLRKPFTILQPGDHSLRIDLLDYFGNKTTIHVPIIAGQKPKPDKQWINPAEITGLIEKEGQNIFWHYLDQKSHWQTINPEDAYDFLRGNLIPVGNGASGTNHFDFLEPYIKITKTDSQGIEYFPQFIVPDNFVFENEKIDLELIVKDPFAVVEISSQYPILTPLLLHMRNKNTGFKELELTAHNLYKFSAWFPAYELAEDSTTFVLYIKKDVIKKPIVQKSYFYHRIPVDQKYTLSLPGLNGELNFPAYASNRNIYLSLEQVRRSDLGISVPGDSISPVFRVNPPYAGFLKSIELSIPVSSDIDRIRQIGIYTPNLRKKKWNFVSNQYDSKNQMLKTRLISISRFTLLRDDEPPKVRLIYPANGKTTSNSKPTIRIHYSDNLSKIGSEDDFEMLLDGQFYIGELDPEVDQIKFIVEKPLSNGWHKIDFWIQDQAGNRTNRSYSFRIENTK